MRGVTQNILSELQNVLSGTTLEPGRVRTDPRPLGTTFSRLTALIPTGRPSSGFLLPSVEEGTETWVRVGDTTVEGLVDGRRFYWTQVRVVGQEDSTGETFTSRKKDEV